MQGLILGLCKHRLGDRTVADPDESKVFFLEESSRLVLTIWESIASDLESTGLIVSVWLGMANMVFVCVNDREWKRPTSK